jgi:hypothetical protein
VLLGETRGVTQTPVLVEELIAWFTPDVKRQRRS